MNKFSTTNGVHITFINKLLSSTQHTITIYTHFIAIIILLGTVTHVCHGHGRLIEPPSRSSAWRYGFQTPPNYNDHELYCGGFTRQQRNGGKCGECGDAWDAPEPRANEYGGRFGQGVVVRKYTPGTEITLRVELTASHMGYFEFRVCPEIAAKQDCLDKHLLELMGGTPSMPNPSDLKTRFYPRNGSRIYEIKGKLPDGLECPNCVLQWRYIAGNNWGMCADGTGAVGCGAQEEFRACSDITIGDVGPQPPLRPLRPVTRPTTKITKPTNTTTVQPPMDTEIQTDAQEHGPRYLGPIIAILALLVVLCALAAIYLYHYHGQRIKQLMQWKREQKTQNISFPPAIGNHHQQQHYLPPPPSVPPPVPPPRTKRLSQTVHQDGEMTKVLNDGTHQNESIS